MFSMIVLDIFLINLFRLGPKKGQFSGNSKGISWELSHLIPLERKYEVIQCLFLLESSVLIGPIEEPAVGMVVVDGRLAHLGLGKLRAFRAVGRLGGH